MFFDSNIEKEIYEMLRKIFKEKFGESEPIILDHPKIPDGFGSYLNADLAIIHGIFGIILCEIKGINLKDIKSIKDGKIEFRNRKIKKDPWRQVDKYKNMLIKALDEEYYVTAKVILPYIESSDFRNYDENFYNTIKNNTIFKDELNNGDISKLFLSGDIKLKTLNRKDIIKITGTLGFKIEDEIISNNHLYKLSTPDGIYYYDEKIISILRDYSGGIKIIKGMAGTGKTIILLSFIDLKKDELRKKSKHAAIICFNEPLYLYLEEMIQSLGVSDIVILRRFVTNNRKNHEALMKDLCENNIEYILIDEFQDIPIDLARSIIGNCNNVLVFVDETQKIYKEEGVKNWKDILGDKFKPNQFSYLRIVYRNPSNIFDAGKSILLYDREIRNYLNVNEKIIGNSFPISEIGGMALYEQDKEFEKLIEDICVLNDSLINKLKIGILVNGGKDEEKKEKAKLNKILKHKNIDIDVKSYLRAKGLEYDIVILKDFWKFLRYYKHIKGYPYIYRMAYVSISRAKFGLFIPIPEKPLNNDTDINNIYNELHKRSKWNYNELINDLKLNLSKENIETYQQEETMSRFNLTNLSRVFKIGRFVTMINFVSNLVNIISYIHNND